MHATMYIRHIEREWIEKRIKQENITLSAVYHEAQKKKKRKIFSVSFVISSTTTSNPVQRKEISATVNHFAFSSHECTRVKVERS